MSNDLTGTENAMRWKPKRSPFGRGKRGSGPIVSASTCCCSCCCSCLLAPVGQFTSEKIVKKVTKHDKNVWWQTLLTFLMFAFCAVLGGAAGLGSKDIGFGVVTGAGLYLVMLYLFSARWLTPEQADKRVKFVLIQFGLSLLFIAIFSGLSLLFLLPFLK